jgi:hypothetical protein
MSSLLFHPKGNVPLKLRKRKNREESYYAGGMEIAGFNGRG